VSLQAGDVELFLLKCAPLKLATDAALHGDTVMQESSDIERDLRVSVSQFSSELRQTADAMAEFYKLFYMIENDIRNLISDTLNDMYGPDWWDVKTPPSAKEECRANQQREAEFGVTSRSDRELDYVSFGQLGDIIRHNWDIFGGIISNQKALGRVMHALNNLRGPIAHCGVLAEDEVDRLKLTVKDWFRLLEGPKAR
jgi:hypothetical protein